MALEIERKYLVTGESFKRGSHKKITQGYLSLDPNRIVRIRIEGNVGILTIKGKTVGISRPEFEYTIPVEDAMKMLKMIEGSLIEKTRYELFAKGKLWQVDVFHGLNDGLVVAEVELRAADEIIELPEWIGQEVSDESRYANASLIKNPFYLW